MDHILAIDIGGTFLKYGIVTREGEILSNSKIKTPKTIDELLLFLESQAMSQPFLAGIAVSSPGAVSEAGFVYGSSAVHYLHGPNMKALIREKTGLPVFMENDAHCAAYAEIWKGAAAGKMDVMVIVIGTGIGGAVIKNGKLHKGDRLHGGEFGYMLLNSNIESSDDVWSRIASMKALVKKVAKRKRMEPSTLTGEEIFEMAENGDPVCREAVNDFYHLLAIGIYNLQYIYDPEIILIGGGISARPDLIEHINDKLDRILSLIDLAKIKPRIQSCRFRQHANILGAVYGWLKQEHSINIKE
ncbi:ROK family protein [Sediminibacillus halophilus]|uniref:Sugar kinase of the NBD/HSP70 family, may contain an N-terminal HTH domain n=1 Tax=Sediminibacillus halophilus TaxID=482461 RepID=A0A1G9N9U0_9BACI|nr:ROK family protein [Sediminibacillus halophilus]SDL83214.1 Sugar kinase of the NBD/HSP70 family, may contain an N-terminal HTH domain [Sediminibacillus halophilus]